MSDLVSVIVPVYNDKNYIDKCINCIINQTYENIELLLVVDGATDGTYEICKEYAKKDNRVKVYYKENSGTAETRNYGLSKANGKYICFMDTDDYATNDFIEVLYKGIKETKADISTVRLKEVDENSSFSTDTYRKNEYEILNKEEAIAHLFDDELYGNFVWNKMFNKKLFYEVKFKKIVKIEDLGVMYLIFDKANYVCTNKSQLYFYVQRKKSQLHKKELKIFTTKINVMYERFEYVKNKYPNIVENYVEYAKALIECYPFVFYKKDLNKKCHKDLNDIWDKASFYLTNKEKRKAKLFGLI